MRMWFCRPVKKGGVSGCCRRCVRTFFSGGRVAGKGLQVVLVGCLACGRAGAVTEIISQPRDVNNCTGRVAVFFTLYSGEADTAFWKINETFYNEESAPDEIRNYTQTRFHDFQDDQVKLSVLTVLSDAPSYFDQTRVQCVLQHDNVTVANSNIALLTYGQCWFPVDNLTVSAINNRLRLDWSPVTVNPPEITGGCLPPPDRRYELAITDITDPQNPQPVGLESGYNDTGLSYTFTPPESNACNHYQFRQALVFCPGGIEKDEPRREKVIDVLWAASVQARFDGQQQVQVRWPPLENSSYRLAINDLNRNVTVTCNDCTELRQPQYDYNVTGDCGDQQLQFSVALSECNATNRSATARFNRSNQQYPVANLTVATDPDQTAIRLAWQPGATSLATRYLLSVNDITDPNHPVPVNCDQCQQSFTGTDYTFGLEPDRTCDAYEFRVTEARIAYPECDETGQTNFSTVTASRPPRPSVISTNFTDSTVQADWTPVDNSTYRVTITDLRNNAVIQQEECDNCPPYGFTPETCGDYHLRLAVSPARCDGPAFTRETEIRFQVNCPTTATTPAETDASTPSEHSAATGFGGQKLPLTAATLLSVFVISVPGMFLSGR